VKNISKAKLKRKKNTTLDMKPVWFSSIEIAR